MKLTEKEQLARLIPLAKAVANMRHLQKRYFKLKEEYTLKEAKKMEKEVDARLFQLEQEQVIQRKK